MPPFEPASTASLDLSIGDDKFLLDQIDACKSRDVNGSTGAYEVNLGKPIVQVTGIRKVGNDADVDFIWYFKTINKLGHPPSSDTDYKRIRDC